MSKEDTVLHIAKLQQSQKLFLQGLQQGLKDDELGSPRIFCREATKGRSDVRLVND